MQRSFMQIYVEGSDQAIVFYQTAFDATVVASYPNADGTFLHAELDIQGQILALTERKSEYAIGGATNTGNTMQYCLEFGEGHEEDVKKAYDILKEDAHILIQLAPCEYSSLMADLVDKYGIRLYGDNVNEKYGITRDTAGDAGKTQYLRGKASI